MKKLFDKPGTRDLEEEFLALLDELVEEYSPLAIFLTGSLAKGEFVRGMSDIDLLLITREPPRKERRSAMYCVKDVDVQVTVFGLQEAKRSLRKGNWFLREALKEGVLLYRSEGFDPEELDV